MMLTPRQRALIQFENGWARHTGLKVDQIRARFDLNPTDYYIQVRAVAKLRTARSLYPSTCARLLRRERRNQWVRDELERMTSAPFD